MSAALMSPPKPTRRTSIAVGDVVTDPTIRRSYRVEGLIAKGGMGEVFRGHCVETREPCAIKSILCVLADDPKTVLRTQLEAIGLRELRHDNVVQVFASGVGDDGCIFMVMQLLHGETLQELLDRRGKLTVRQAIKIARDVCLGLDAVHQYAIHRDIKPANIHLGLDGVVRLLDLGACKWKKSGLQLTSTGMQLGTFVFMSPEQLDDSAPLDARSDIWSLGVVLFLLLTGVNPFAYGGTLPENKFVVGTRIIKEPHIPLLELVPGAPTWLTQILNKALAKKPEHRFQSAEDFGRVLTGALHYLEQQEGPIDFFHDLLEEMDLARPTMPMPPKLLAPLGRTLPLRKVPSVPTLAEQQRDQAMLALAVTEEVPLEAPDERAPRDAGSGEYMRATTSTVADTAPLPRGLHASALDDGDVASAATATAQRQAMWIPLVVEPAPLIVEPPPLVIEPAPLVIEPAPRQTPALSPPSSRPRSIEHPADIARSRLRVRALLKSMGAVLGLTVLVLLVAYVWFGPELLAMLQRGAPGSK
jgi:serine/threonine protein kinase